MAIQTGNQAPDFLFVSTDKKEVTLQDYKGKNFVLLFFPLAFTGVCTTELCTMRDNIADYNGMDAEILAVSVDSPMTLGKFKESLDLNFTVASDWNKTGSAAYGALYEEFVLGMKGVSKRSAFVIDGDGVVQYAEVLESAGDLPDFGAIQNTLKALK